VLTPLTYLGGVFFSIQLLPPFWQGVAQLNPILYMVNAFRFGMLGSADISIGFAYAIMLAAAAGLSCAVHAEARHRHQRDVRPVWLFASPRCSRALQSR
jgi:ABC-2 type transport system permease protein